MPCTHIRLPLSAGLERVPAEWRRSRPLAPACASLAGVLYVWWQGQISPPDVGLIATIELLVMAVIGGLWRIEGAWLGAFAFIVINNYVRDVEMPVIGGSFNTIIGLIFLAIVVVSPGGLMGLWGRATDLVQRGRRVGAGRVAAGRTGGGS